MMRGKKGSGGERGEARRRVGLAAAVALAALAGTAACGEPEGGDGDGGDGDGDSCDISTVIEVDLETGEATIGPSLGRYVSSAYGAGEDIWALTDDRLHRVTADGLGDPVGSRAAFVSLGDLDSDGDLDAVTSITSTSGGSSFTVVAREGDALDQVETESVAANATHVALADANDDGHLDVLALVDGYLRLHTGDGQLNFELASDPGVGGDNTDWVSAGDVNGDGAIDVVAAISPIGTPSGEPDEVFLSVWVGEGDGTFAEPTRIVLRERFPDGYASRLIDVDADGFLDVVLRIEERLLVAGGDSAAGFAPLRELTADLGRPAAGDELSSE